jgi:hypothetical protein
MWASASSPGRGGVLSRGVVHGSVRHDRPLRRTRMCTDLMYWDAHSPQLIVWIERTQPERHLGRMLGPLSARPSGSSSAWTPPIRRRRVVDLLVAEVDGGGGIQREPLVISEVERLLLSRLLLAQPSNYSPLLHQDPRRTAPPRTIRHAAELIEAHAAESWRTWPRRWDSVCVCCRKGSGATSTLHADDESRRLPQLAYALAARPHSSPRAFGRDLNAYRKFSRWFAAGRTARRGTAAVRHAPTGRRRFRAPHERFQD